MTSEIRKIWTTYRAASLLVKLRILGRHAACPFSRLAQAIPDRGDILDVGCGHGLLALSLMSDEESEKRNYIGIDHDKDKIVVAQNAQIRDSEFFSHDLSDIPSESFDTVAVVDVLYCVPLNQWPVFLENCTRVLRKGGLMVLGEAIPTVRWKQVLLRWEEFLAVKVFRITKGANPHFENLNTFMSHIEAAGFCDLEVEFLYPKRPHSHCLITARKPQ